jgi:rhodanese-related sulfurtransferase
MEHPGSSRSERAVALLRESGYQAQALDGGFPTWKEDGYPTETGE